MNFELVFNPGSSSGWGVTGDQETSTDKLQETTLRIVPSSRCLEGMNQTSSVEEHLIVCAGGDGVGPCEVS